MATDEKGGNLDEKKRLLIKQKLGGGKSQMQYLISYCPWFYVPYELLFQKYLRMISKKILHVIIFHKAHYMSSKRRTYFHIHFFYFKNTNTSSL